MELEDDATAHFVPKPAKPGKAHKPVVSSEKAAAERGLAACPKCSLPTVSRGGMVFCSKAWEPVYVEGGTEEQFSMGGSNESGGTGCGWSEAPVKGAGRRRARGAAPR